MISLQAMLGHSADRAPDDTVFTQRDQATSYGELDRASGVFAHGLQEAGVRQGDRVVLVLNNTIDYLISYYGIL